MFDDRITCVLYGSRW